MRYIFLYFYRWLKSILLNLHRICFCREKYEYQRYVPGDIVVINPDGDKYFVEVLSVVRWKLRLKPLYRLKSVMRIGYDPSRPVSIVVPNRRATPLEMRNYALFLSQLQFASGDWFYNKITRNNIYQVLKVDSSKFPNCCPFCTVLPFSECTQKTFNISSSDIKLPNKPQFKYNQRVYIEPFHDYGNIIGANLICSDNLMYEISINGLRKRYSEDELLKFQNHITMDKTTTETKVFEPLFKVGDKVKVVTPKDPKNYRFGYAGPMKELEGRIGVITSCYIYCGTKSDQDDNYVYKIDIDHLSLSWSSQSFVKVEPDEDGPQPLFKVGDKVKIVLPKNRLKSRVGCTDTMQKMESTVAIITHREKCKNPNGYDDDGYIYNVDTNRYCWSSQFFVKVESSVTEDSKLQPLFKIGDIVKILPPKSPTRYRHGYNGEMRALEGKAATITSCKLDDLVGPYNDDGYAYTIDIDDWSFKWSSQSFMKLEEPQHAILSTAQADITSVRVDGTLLTTSPIQCSKLSIFDCISDDKSAKKEKEEKKERYKLNFKIK